MCSSDLAQMDGGAPDLFEAGAALKDDQGADPVLLKVNDRLGHSLRVLVDDLVRVGCVREKSSTSQLLQQTPQLRLKDLCRFTVRALFPSIEVFPGSVGSAAYAIWHFPIRPHV